MGHSVWLYSSTHILQISWKQLKYLAVETSSKHLHIGFYIFKIQNANFIQLIVLNHPQNNIPNVIGQLLVIYFYLYFFLYNLQIHIQDLLKNYI